VHTVYVSKLRECYRKWLATNTKYRETYLDGIPEPSIALKYHLAPVSSRVLSLKDHSVHNHNETNQTVRTNAESNPEVEILEDVSKILKSETFTQNSPGYPAV